MAEGEDTQVQESNAPTLLSPPELAGDAKGAGRLRPGALLGGQFRLVRPLGQGGMGRVFLARDLSVGRLVAVKTLLEPSRSTERERWLRLFRRDAASTARLEHPNIVRLYHYDVDEGVPFMVLEYLRGCSLERLIQGGALGVEPTLALASQLAAALAYAHERGVVHRDLKPANLIRLVDGRLKVLDFGIALLRRGRDALARDFEMAPEELAEHLGAEIADAGTPLYMAPEQLRGGAQDERVDVWAFGVLLYEMLTGRPPFDHMLQVLDLDHAIDLGAVPHKLGPTPRELIRDCLRRDPDERPRNFGAIQRRCQQDLGGTPPSTPPAQAASKWRPRVQDEFFGRQQELEALTRWRAGEGRVVTVVGPGGVGKTRLVVEWLSRAGEQEAIFVAAAAARSREDLLVAIADALGLHLTSAPIELISQRLRAEPSGALLVIDNVEQVLAPLLTLLEQLLAKSERARFMLTSRSPLRLPAEQVVDVEPLAAPRARRARRPDPGLGGRGAVSGPGPPGRPRVVPLGS